MKPKYVNLLTTLLVYATFIQADELLEPRNRVEHGNASEIISNFRTNEQDPNGTKVQLKNGTEIWVKKDVCSYPYLKEVVPAKFGPPEILAPFNFKNRIYTRMHPEEGRRVVDFVNGNGKFLSPDRFILPGSVVPGEWLGVPGVNFEFVAGKKNLDAWVPTDKQVNVIWSIFDKYAPDGTPIRKTYIDGVKLQ